MTDEDAERWLPIAGYEGLYEVSDRGRVRSLDRTYMRIDGTPLPLRGRVRKTSTDKRYGHLRVSLTLNGNGRTFSVHTLVAKAFLDHPGGPVEVCHIDGDPTNNYVGNLRWDTHQSNVDDMYIHGTRLRGSVCSSAKLTEESVSAIRQLALAGIKQGNIADRFGVARTTVSSVLMGRSWSHVA